MAFEFTNAARVIHLDKVEEPPDDTYMGHSVGRWDGDALVVDVKPWDVHGVGYVDVTVTYRDRTVETARLGRESVPEDLEAGEQVLVSKAVNVIVAIRRA